MNGQEDVERAGNRMGIYRRKGLLESGNVSSAAERSATHDHPMLHDRGLTARDTVERRLSPEATMAERTTHRITLENDILYAEDR